MPSLEIKSSHKPIKDYYARLEDFEKHGATKETSVRAAFQDILQFYAKKRKWSLIPEYGIKLTNGNAGSVDGAVVDAWSQPIGFWEAKDEADKLPKEIVKKFKDGYPKSNILFQKPTHAILVQDNTTQDEYDLTKPDRLVACLTDFFSYREEEFGKWEQIADEFKERIPESAIKLVAMIETEKKENPKFRQAFQTFAELCRSSINPNLADAAIEEMLVQHLLTSRLFASVFNNPEFVRRNVIAAEIEKVVDVLTSRKFNRDDFFAPLEHFYRTLEEHAKRITDWSQKQHFINTVYERFFQGFAVKVADTHGIVYTPQPIVDFMVRSVQHILKTEFGRSLADEGVHILDPFVGTGNFILRIMREIAAVRKSALPKKYANELHCNEVMLLPYYIASMNIEHEFYEQTKEYKPFEGICLVDTFELAEPAQTSMFSTENSERVERQKRSPITVVIGNPPYNAKQVDENDNNKVRYYPAIDGQVKSTYGQDSAATLTNQLRDPFVKAYKYASERIQKNGITAFVSNNIFLDGIAFDGMRKHLLKDFNRIFILDLKGNIRRDSMKDGIALGEKHTVFGEAAMVGVCIAVLVKDESLSDHKIWYHGVPFRATRGEKFQIASTAGSIEGIEFQEIVPDKNNNWLTADDADDFDNLIPLGDKSNKVVNASNRTIFVTFSNGLKSNNDYYVFSHSEAELLNRVTKMIAEYAMQNTSWRTGGAPKDVQKTLVVNVETLKWIRKTKKALAAGKAIAFEPSKVRDSIYSPFTAFKYYFERSFSEDTYQFRYYFPTPESANVLICLNGAGSEKPFSPYATDKIINQSLYASGTGLQCFPFYTYDEDGSNRRENITDWALEEFRTKLGLRPPGPEPGALPGKAKAKINSALSTEHSALTKWDVFYYVYGLLHHPEYRTKYAANLRRELPRIPIPEGRPDDFWKFSKAGKKLADLHVNYESVPEYDLQEEWAPGSGLNYRVEKMKLTKDKTTIVYNDDLMLRGIPPEVFEYKLGNRSALDWIIDQYQVSTDKRSGITNDPNREDDPRYIISLIKRIVTVSLETVGVVREIERFSLTF